MKYDDGVTVFLTYGEVATVLNLLNLMIDGLYGGITDVKLRNPDLLSLREKLAQVAHDA